LTGTESFGENCVFKNRAIWKGRLAGDREGSGNQRVELLTAIPFELDLASLGKIAHVEADSDDGRDFAALVEEARAVARPKAVFRECYVDGRAEESVTIDGVVFTSRALRTHLDRVERVFAYVATCGRELDQVAIDGGDLLKQFWLDTIKNVLLRVSMRHLSEHIDRRYALGKAATMSPGSADASVWPIEQQRQLFSLLGDVEAAIGVQLTDSCLMVPNKSLSGVRFPTEVDFRSCQLCRRENCPSRSAPFDHTLWRSIGHE